MSDARINIIKKKMLESVQVDLTAQSFERPGSDSDMVAACAELLMFFSIGGAERRNNLEVGEKEWWNSFCDLLKAAGRARTSG